MSPALAWRRWTGGLGSRRAGGLSSGPRPAAPAIAAPAYPPGDLGLSQDRRDQLDYLARKRRPGVNGSPGQALSARLLADGADPAVQLRLLLVLAEFYGDCLAVSTICQARLDFADAVRDAALRLAGKLPPVEQPWP